MAKGYLVANLVVEDPALFAQYRDAVEPVIARHGGRYLCRGGALDPVEHGERFNRVVIVEFESFEAAQRFYRSAEYAPLIALRERATRSEVVLVEGV